MPKLSVLFASVRPDYANVALMNLIASLAQSGADFEIVCVAPFPLAGHNIKYIPEGEPRGCYPAYAKALDASTGDVVAFFTDDMIAAPGWANGLIDEIMERERRFSPYVGNLKAVNSDLFSTVYDLYFANWPVFSRRTAQLVGKPFGDEFIHHFGDCDLALRVWTMGGRVEMLPHRRMFVLRENTRRMSPFAAEDKLMSAFVKFRQKWSPVLGADPNLDFQTVCKTGWIDELTDNTFIGPAYPPDHRFRHPTPPQS